jgi:hypothetical protein
MQAEPAFTSFDQIEELPQVTWRDRALLPDEPGLYFVLVGTDVLYVGRSGRLRTRWNQYPLRCVFEQVGPFSVAFQLIEDIDTLKATEKAVVRALRPLFNTHYVEGSLDHSRQTRAWFRKLTGPRKQTPPA